MRAHYLKHVPFEGLGSIEPWLAAAGYEITCTAFYAGDRLPELPEFDLLVVMGGPMSVHDQGDYPWLAAEKQFIRAAVEKGIPTLGICLGAQLIAACLGAAVYPNAAKEIGWFPVVPVSGQEPDIFRFPEEVTVFHWHGETFDLPKGAVHLARSRGCVNQAFQLGNHVIGLQFHLETTPESAENLVANCADELVEGAFIQTENEILSAPPARYAAINRLMADILAYLLRK